jgi:hypothetical protein
MKSRKEKQFKEVKLFSGVIYKNKNDYDKAKSGLERRFSPIDLESDEIPFDQTTYYNQEMGSPLFRRFLSFRDLIDPQKLPEIKQFTNLIENKMSLSGNRTVNIDPGFLSEANIIIATTKNYFHRVPLQKGIYAHLEYVIRKKEIVPLEWTYPDFKKPEYLNFFYDLRRIYKLNLKKDPE